MLAGAVGSRPIQQVGFVELEWISIDYGQAALLDLPTDTIAARKLLQDEGEQAPTGTLQDSELSTAQEGCLANVNFLLENGAEVDAKFTRNGATALMVAASSGHSAVVEQLIAGGADVNAQNDDGLTVLGLAAVHEGNSKVILALIDAGADVNAQNDFGVPPLHNAAVFGHKDNVEALLSRGADAAAISDVDGKTAQEAVCWCLLLEETDSCNVDFCSERAEELRALFD
ncbi:hypothetical protein BSKO_12578 [Bryopsis sp. KO-2023]|nr:hypothetical protein BSKO_12578 [Bryopsis sp. KO-2023]